MKTYNELIAEFMDGTTFDENGFTSTFFMIFSTTGISQLQFLLYALSWLIITGLMITWLMAERHAL